jgi:hypothetical protein
MKTGFNVGDRVHSVTVGIKDEFDGIIVEKFKNSDYTFHVEDPSDGTLWHRNHREIELIKEDQWPSNSLPS